MSLQTIRIIHVNQQFTTYRHCFSLQTITQDQKKSLLGAFRCLEARHTTANRETDDPGPPFSKPTHTITTLHTLFASAANPAKASTNASHGGELWFDAEERSSHCFRLYRERRRKPSRFTSASPQRRQNTRDLLREFRKWPQDRI